MARRDDADASDDERQVGMLRYSEYSRRVM
jgi:hypothetical protein